LETSEAKRQGGFVDPQGNEHAVLLGVIGLFLHVVGVNGIFRPKYDDRAARFELLVDVRVERHSSRYLRVPEHVVPALAQRLGYLLCDWFIVVAVRDEKLGSH
jgi:hypothetical protein